MIMIQAKHANSLLLLTTCIVLYSFRLRFCRAQGNSTSSRSPCETSGKCGPYAICNSQASPMCICLQGFYPQNNQEWSSGNWTSGCVRRVPLNCEENKNGGREDRFLKIHVSVASNYSDLWSGPENQCEDRCLRNCSCMAYRFDGGIGCRFWSIATFVDILKLPGGSISDLYVRVSNSELDSLPKKENPKLDQKKKTTITLVVVGFLIISVFTYFSWKWIAKHRDKKKTNELAKGGAFGPDNISVQDALSQLDLQDLPLFKFEMLAKATNNFSEANKLGKGGFGPVYKGELVNGREIAIKRLSQASRQGMQEFMNEVVLISKLQHRNLVRLLGCCIDNEEIMLIYEYMPNKSLDFFLFDSSQEILDWSKRFNIIEGICRGLLYLHMDSRLKIIHRDLKPSNILLDNDYNPKISDFGMARIFVTMQDHVSTQRVVGTYGYMAPEYAMGGRFSEKSDVFSFGVLLLEIVTGKRNSSFYNENGPWNLLGHVSRLKLTSTLRYPN